MNKNCDSSGRKCAEAKDAAGNLEYVNKFSVNDQTAGNVVGDGGVLRTTLKFFAWADPNHMPIRHMIVDFGDGIGKYDAPDGPYPNRRGYNDQGLTQSNCDLTWTGAPTKNFGQSSDACIARPISIEHTYQCVRGACTTSTGGNCWDPNATPTTGACVFHPRVYVEDNWGYCTGTCPGDPAGNTCFDTRECNPDDPSSASWVNFGGKVIVLPP